MSQNRSFTPQEKMFPVLTGKYGTREGVCVPWALVDPHAKQADRNHSQTLERLAERGGLSACELAAVLEDREWHHMEESAAWAAVFRAAASVPSETLPLLRLTALEQEMVLRAIGFAQAGEWPWEPFRKVEANALESAARKLAEPDIESANATHNDEPPCSERT